eukprot:251029-Rhodomonas_salina.2
MDGAYSGTDGVYAGNDGVYAGTDGVRAGMDEAYAGTDIAYAGTRLRHTSNRSTSTCRQLPCLPLLAHFRTFRSDFEQEEGMFVCASEPHPEINSIRR